MNTYKRDYIEVFGSTGSRTQKYITPSFRINNSIFIDAGNIVMKLEEGASVVEHVLITHAHFDHIVDLPFVIENCFDKRTKPLNIYGLKYTIDALKEHLFNNIVWPDFSKIPLISGGQPSMIFHEIEYEKEFQIENFVFRPFEVNHLIPTSGFVITDLDLDSSIFITADTYLSDHIWQEVEKNKKIKTIITEISFHSALNGLAEVSKHLTPDLLNQELSKVKREDIKILVYHLKSTSYDIIEKEIHSMEFLKKFQVEILVSNEKIYF
jgi:cAMP phosphodiesterase